MGADVPPGLRHLCPLCATVMRLNDPRTRIGGFRRMVMNVCPSCAFYDLYGQTDSRPEDWLPVWIGPQS